MNKMLIKREALLEKLTDVFGSSSNKDLYMWLIKASSHVRFGMTAKECRQASVELILEADSEIE